MEILEIGLLSLGLYILLLPIVSFYIDAITADKLVKVKIKRDRK